MPATPNFRAGVAASGRRTACAVAIAAVLGGSALRAQTPPGSDPAKPDLTGLGLEGLMQLEVGTVVAASRFVQDIGQAPATVSVVTGDEIRLQGFRTLADVLRSVHGFYITYDRNYSYLGVRGFARPGDYNTRVLVLVNGHRLNDAVFDMALLGTEFPIDIALLDRVEIIRGPSSSLYGTSAFFAVVNLLTRRTLDGHRGELAVEAGSLDTARVRGSIAHRTGTGGSMLFSATAYRSDGQRTIRIPELDAPERPAIASRLDEDRSGSVFGSFSQGTLTLDGAFGTRRKSIPTGAFDTVVDRPGTRTLDAQGYVAATYARRLSPAWTLEARGGFDRYAYDGDYLTDPGDGNSPYLFADSGRAADVTTDLLVTRAAGAHRFTTGADVRWNVQQDQTADEASARILDDRRHSVTAGVYAQDEWRLSPHVLVNGGLRLDRYATFGSTLNPRVGVILTPTSGTVFKVLAGRAFRAPSTFELYYETGQDPHIEPETIWTGEVALEQRAGTHADVAASFYRYDVSDLITQRDGGETPDGLYFANAGSVAATGVEGELRLHWNSGLRIRAAHSYGTATDEHEDQLTNSPHHLSRGAVIVPLGVAGLVFASNLEYIGDRRTIRGPVVKGATMTNVTLSRHRSGQHATFACSIYNVFDSRYVDPASGEHRQVGIPQDGRTVLARFQWAF